MRQLNGFDLIFAPAYYEDTDLAMRVREAGYRVMYTPFSKVIHYEGVSSGTNENAGVKRYQLVNRKKFYEKDLTQFRKLTRASNVRNGFTFNSAGKVTAIQFRGSGSDTFRINWKTI